MATFGKTIRLFLVEGNTNGMITAELSNWTGKAFKIPRIKLKEYAGREELKNPGVYILFGKNDNNDDAAYIGEGEPITDRIQSHYSKKDFWNEALLFVSKDKYLNKASIKYLENRLHELAKKANRYAIDNDNTPTKSGVSEPEQAELEEFLSNIKLLTSSLGHRIFEEIGETIEKEDNKDLIFFCKSTSGVSASGSPSTEGFVVFQDAIFSKVELPSLTESIRKEKQKMIIDGLLNEVGDFYKLQKHYNFNSSSRAAAMLLGRSASGPLEWKTAQGVQLKKFEESV
jgi:hypothetical protein